MTRVKAAVGPDDKVIVGLYLLKCPACKFSHQFRTREYYKEEELVVKEGEKGPPVWDFNGNMEFPTVGGSLGVHYPREEGEIYCHSTITDGKITFADDSTHELKNQTLDLPNLE